MKKPFLLFPGRHLVNTTFQAEYLKRLRPKTVIYAVTSSNQENSRYNPIPFYLRAVGVDRFAGELKAETGMGYQIFPIPHYGHTANFAEFTIREIEHQSEGRIRLTPRNCEVICSTPEVAALYEALGFHVWPAEAGEPKAPVTPIQVINQIAHSKGNRWPAAMAYSHRALFSEIPAIPAKIRRLYQDPLTTQDGALTENRNYSVYARGMNEIIRLKYTKTSAPASSLDGLSTKGAPTAPCCRKSARTSPTPTCSASTSPASSPAASKNGNAPASSTDATSISSTGT